MSAVVLSGGKILGSGGVVFNVGAASGTLTITTNSVPTLTNGGQFGLPLTASGGAAPYTWGLNYSISEPISAFSNTTNNVITLAASVTGSTNPFAGQTQALIYGGPLGFAYGYSALPVVITATGGSSGAWTVTTTTNGTLYASVATTPNITGTTGQFSVPGDTGNSVNTGCYVTITGTLTGTGTISGYTSGTLYYCSSGGYSFTLQTSTGGTLTTTAGTTTGLTFTLAGGTLQSGHATGSTLFAVTIDGWLEGVGAANESDTINIICTDLDGNTATKTLSATVNSTLAILNRNLGLTTQPMPLAMAGNAYGGTISGGSVVNGYTLAAAGGTGTGYTWSLSGQPSGMSITTTTSTSGNGNVGYGVITWASPTQGTYTFSASVTDSGSNTASANYSLTVAANANQSRPSYNTGSGFFTVGAQLYDPNGAPIYIRGLDENHYDAGSAQAYWLTSANAVRVFLYYGHESAGLTACVQPFQLNNGIFPIVTRASDDSGLASTGSGDAGVSTTKAGLGTMVSEWVSYYSIWSPVMNKIGINIANEWGPSTASLWQTAYEAVWQSAISSISGTTITLSSSAATHPFANAAALAFVYITGGGVTGIYQISTTVGGSAGAWTLTATSTITGYTSGGTVSGGAVGVLRAAGYLCPLFIDYNGSGQGSGITLAALQAIQSSDPQQNVVFSRHTYSSITNYQANLGSVTKGSSTVITLNCSLPYNPMSPYTGLGPNWYSTGVPTVTISGVQGMTGLNGTFTASSVGGSQGAWTITVPYNSTSAPNYTANTGTMIDNEAVTVSLQTESGYVANGVPIIIGEFGPAYPPLANGPSPTPVSQGQVISACESLGLPWIYWAFDDHTGADGVNGASWFGATYQSGAYTVPTGLTPMGFDVILNPSRGLCSLPVIASYYV